MDDVLVIDCMKSSPLYVWEDDSLQITVGVMRKYYAEAVTVLSRDNRIIGSISRESAKNAMMSSDNISCLKKLKVKDILAKENSLMIFYPKMKIEDAYSTMRCFNINCVPVADVPWEKRIIGFLSLDDILPIVKKNNLKVSF